MRRASGVASSASRNRKVELGDVRGRRRAGMVDDVGPALNPYKVGAPQEVNGVEGARRPPAGSRRRLPESPRKCDLVEARAICPLAEIDAW
jgi:hypothetical protein